jgi:HD-GYP domain-containing protein (c-di-GMP phosphodiesterase class II)/biotin operon repressor
MTARLRLADLLSGFSIVADMGYGLPVGESMRSCLVAVALAQNLGLSNQEVADTLYTSLLLHVGCVGFSHEMSTIFNNELTANRAGAKTNFADLRDILTTLIPEATNGLGPQARLRAAAYVITRGRALGRRYDTTVCEVARQTARRIGLSDGVQGALYEVKEWWNGEGSPRGLKGEEIRLPARIARAAAEAVLFDDIGGVELAVYELRRRAGVLLDPNVVAAFIAQATDLLTVAEAEAGDPRTRILAVEPNPVVEKDAAELPTLASAFGDLADLKTPFTHGHSKQVGRLTKAAAERMGLDAQAVERVHVAALLHDLGRAGVTNAIWEKQGPLTSAEWEQVRLHPYYSERILSTSHELAPMGAIAGMHHERLDGSGYHRGSRAGDLTIGARILAAADAFQGMTENRPHRAPLDAPSAAEELRIAARAGKLDPDAVAAVIEAAGLERGRRRELRPAGLSEREIQVLRLVARACSNPEIAEHLNISRRTAEHHVQHIYTKVGVSTRSALALYALEQDLLPPPPEL